ncbi:MAG TPA: DUF3592 domain-containing protein [Terracidiphilus sp.]|jgi:hypothetical protein|nr:DUF3592 domain-containing protein [Terracidiphilus sp.]
MLIEMWEKLRGYDKWVETTAKIEASEMEKIPNTGRDGSTFYTYDSADLLTWIDTAGEKQHADFTVDDQSPLYQFVGGESVVIRYDPADPSRFYYRELLRSRVNLFFRTALATAFMLALVGGRFVIRVVQLVRHWNH